METSWSPAFAVLDVLVARFDEPGAGMPIKATYVAERTDLSPEQVSRAVRDYLHPGYVEVEFLEDTDAFLIQAVTEKGRSAVDQWADATVNRLAQALRDAADQAIDPDAASKLQDAAEVISGVARTLAVKAVENRLDQ